MHRFKSRTYHNVATEFAEGATQGKNSTGTLFIDGNTIYSYGWHFPIAVLDRSKKIAYFNTDSYSHTTSCHQGVVKRELNSHGFKLVQKNTEELKKLSGSGL